MRKGKKNIIQWGHWICHILWVHGRTQFLNIFVGHFWTVLSSLLFRFYFSPSIQPPIKSSSAVNHQISTSNRISMCAPTAHQLFAPLANITTTFLQNVVSLCSPWNWS
jgi:hypothetical protein